MEKLIQLPTKTPDKDVEVHMETNLTCVLRVITKVYVGSIVEEVHCRAKIYFKGSLNFIFSHFQGLLNAPISSSF